jgi:hypothetical protein
MKRHGESTYLLHSLSKLIICTLDLAKTMTPAQGPGTNLPGSNGEAQHGSFHYNPRSLWHFPKDFSGKKRKYTNILNSAL